MTKLIWNKVRRGVESGIYLSEFGFLDHLYPGIIYWWIFMYLYISKSTNEYILSTLWWMEVMHN